MSTQISRRTIAQGTAWAVPVIAIGAAAPRSAASPNPCVPSTDYDTLKPGTSPKTIVFSDGTVASLSYDFNGAPPGDTGKVARTSTNPAWNYIEVEMLADGRRDDLDEGDTVTVTITFPQGAVENLALTLHDIDWVAGDWQDQVIINAPLGTGGYSLSKGSNLKGSGTAADPIQPVKSGDLPIDSGNNRVIVNYPGRVTQVSFTYRAGITGSSGNQHIGLGNLSFQKCGGTTPKSVVAPQVAPLSGSSDDR